MADSSAVPEVLAPGLPGMEMFEGGWDMLPGNPALLSETSGDIWAAIADGGDHFDISSEPAAQRRRLDAEGSAAAADVAQQQEAPLRRTGRKQPPTKERKKDREKARRQRENDCFSELGQLVDPGQTGRGDKLSILTGATKEIQRLRSDNDALRKLNSMLEDWAAQLKVQRQQQPQQGHMPPMMFGQPHMWQQFQALQGQQTQPQQQTTQPQAAQLVATQSQQQQPMPLQAQLQPQHLQPQPEMAMVSAAAFQQLLANAKAAFAQQAPLADATGQAPPQPAVKVEGSAGDVLAPAACLYMPSSELDVSADGAKRPVAA